jgi:hypothetical protein
MLMVSGSFASRFVLKVTFLGCWATLLPLGGCSKSPIVVGERFSAVAIVADAQAVYGALG